MNPDATLKLGLQVRPCNLEAFAEFVPDEAAAKMFERAATVAVVHSLSLDQLRVQISLRPELLNAVQFIVTGPHGRASNRRQISYLAMVWPDRNVPIVRDGWTELNRPFGASVYWEHVENEGETV